MSGPLDELKDALQHLSDDLAAFKSNPKVKAELDKLPTTLETLDQLRDNVMSVGSDQALLELKHKLSTQLNTLLAVVENEPALAKIDTKTIHTCLEDAGVGNEAKLIIQQRVGGTQASATFYFDSAEEAATYKTKLAASLPNVEIGESADRMASHYVTFPIDTHTTNYTQIISNAGLGTAITKRDQMALAQALVDIAPIDYSHLYNDVKTGKLLTIGVDLNTGTQAGNVAEKSIQQQLEKYKEEAGPTFNPEVKWALTIQGKLAGDFNYQAQDHPNMDPAYLTNADKYVGKTDFGFNSGDARLPKDVYQGALNLADEMIASAKAQNIDLKKSEFAPAAELDGNSKTLTREELASYLVASSFAQDRSDEGKGDGFDNTLRYYAELINRDYTLELIKEYGKQILGDNYNASLNTNTPTSDTAYKTFKKNNSYTGIK